MKAIRNTFVAISVIFIATYAGTAASASYQSLDGMTGMEIAYDFRLDNPKIAALFLRLIHETYQDKDVNRMDDAPNFVVVVNGSAVKLIASDQPGYSPEDQKYLAEIAERVAAMAADGIKFEGCLKAAEIFKVDPALFLAEINKINNAWVSLSGYQAQSYSNLVIN